MILSSQFLKKIEILPPSLQKEVDNFVDFLLAKRMAVSKSTKKKTKYTFGSLKGKIKMSNDCNAPLAIM